MLRRYADVLRRNAFTPVHYATLSAKLSPARINSKIDAFYLPTTYLATICLD